MTQDEARRGILAEWPLWTAATKTLNPSGIDALMFFSFLQKERSHLLMFKASGDKWQTVHSWLLRACLVRH